MLWAAAFTAEARGSPSQPAALVSDCEKHTCIVFSRRCFGNETRPASAQSDTVRHSQADRSIWRQECGSTSQEKQRANDCSMLRNCEQLMNDSPS